MSIYTGLMKSIAICFAILLTAIEASASLRIVNYNTAGAARTGMDTVLEAIGDENRNGIAQPVDILLLQEQDSMSTTTQQIVNILNGIYGSGTYARGTLNGDTTGAGRPGIVYNTNTVELLNEVIVNYPDNDGAARSTLRYKLRPVGYSSPDAVFYAYVSHLKASNTTDNASRRGVEVQEIRDNSDALGDGVHILYAGDFNLYTSNEPAWVNFTAPGNGQAHDPVNRVGDWNNNGSFTDVHTQSPVTYEHFGGQITGGMDDRFDFQLITNEFKDGEGLSYISGSYHTFANNNTHGLNNAISNGTGASPTVLAALEDVSDHLPVVADYQVPAKLKVTFSTVPEEVFIDEPATVMVTVENDAGTGTVAGADELDYSISCDGDVFGNASGVDDALNGGQVHYVSLDTATSGTKTGTITVTSSSQGVEIETGNVLNVEYEVIDSGENEYHTLGWEEYAYRFDPNAVLGNMEDISYSVCLSEAHTGQNSLQLESLEPNGAVFPAVIYELDDGDVVNISSFIKTVSGSAGSVQVGAYYLSDHTDINSIVDQASTANIGITDNWTLADYSWIYDDGAGLHDGLLIFIQPQQESLVDDLTIWFTTRGKIVLPYPTNVTCQLYSDIDYNQNCVVDLADFSTFGQYWLDGTLGSTPPGSIDSVMITGIMDGTLTGNTPKAMEIYVDGTQDLSEYSVQQLLDGGSWDTSIPLSGTFSNTYVYLIRTNTDGVNQFNQIFGTTGIFANRVLLDDYLYCDGGNDAFRILKDGVVVDQVYADSSTAVYSDSYLYRNNGTGPDGANWISSNWTIPGNNVLRFKTAEQIEAMVPFGTYLFSADCTQHPELDLSNDCQINLADLVLFLDEWMACNLEPDWACWK